MEGLIREQIIPEMNMCERSITPEQAKELLDKYLAEPILVLEEMEHESEQRAKVPYYYIVPYGFELEIGGCGIPLARLCIIVNAYTGKFEEITVFGSPVRYLPEGEAIAIATKALRLKKEGIEKIKAIMMYRPSDITRIRTYPFWKITFEDKILYVDQLGNVYGAIKPSVPGD